MQILIFIVGVVIGSIISSVMFLWVSSIGELRFEDSDNKDYPIVSAVFTKDPNVVRKKEYVIFKVDSRK